MRPIHAIFGRDAESERLRRPARPAVGSILLVPPVGVLGFVLIGAFQFKPTAGTTLEPGMSLIVMADASGWTRLEQRVLGRWRKSRS